MADSTKTAVQFLAELRKERDELDGLIKTLEKKLGISSGQQISEPPEEGEQVGVAPVTSILTSIPIGFFHNLSQAAAAEKLLKGSDKQPMTTGDILNAFRISGMKLHPRNAMTILYTALKRSDRFERVGNKAWGLKEWYPERKKRMSKEHGTEAKDDSQEV